MSVKKKDEYPNQSFIKRDMVEVATTALTMVFERFDAIETEVARIRTTMATATDITRLENKLDPTIDAVDDLKTKWRLKFGKPTAKGSI